jgi:hypothetical protein
LRAETNVRPPRVLAHHPSRAHSQPRQRPLRRTRADGVSDDFHSINGKLILHDAERSAWFGALKADDQRRAVEFMKIVLFNPELRNRNPLHPSVLDACVPHTSPLTADTPSPPTADR